MGVNKNKKEEGKKSGKWSSMSVADTISSPIDLHVYSNYLPRVLFSQSKTKTISSLLPFLRCLICNHIYCLEEDSKFSFTNIFIILS